MKNFLMFDLMITPWIIRIIYWILQVIVIISGFMAFLGEGLMDEFRDYGPLGGIFIIISGTLILRLFFEILMVQFKIAENTSQIKEYGISAISTLQTGTGDTVKRNTVDIIYCPECGKEQTANSEGKFCSQCGCKL